MKNLLINSVSIFIQIAFVFSFLVIFYFLYVVLVEKDDFNQQMNLIIDNIMSDIINAKIIPSDKLTTDYKIVISGIIDTLEEDIKVKSKEAIKSVVDSNTKLRNKMYKIVLGIFIFVFILIFIFRKQIPYYVILKEAIIVTIFIGLVEFVFLTQISSKYISADPNKVKYIIGESIHNWIQNNKKI